MEPTGEFKCDVLVVDGGITGAGIARDAAGRGLLFLLCERDDLAAHTSSASTKLIHGGLRYLEHFEFGLVRKALIEREVLLRAAPHIIKPLRFVMPHDISQRPARKIRAGLFLYDGLARRVLLPGSCAVDLRQHPAGRFLNADCLRGFEYSDAWVDDARLVVLNAVDAARKGARVFTRTRCESAVLDVDRWAATLRTACNQAIGVMARCIVNATGPWASQFLQDAAHQPERNSLRLIKGSHIVVKRRFTHPFAYIFQHSDGRIVFAIPYERDFTLIGTTDLEYHGDANQVSIDADEIAYLCELSRRYFRMPILPDDMVWSNSGVRPLLEDASSSAASVTRDYRFELVGGKLPMLSVFGGKLTTFRKLSEEALDLIAPLLANHHGAWTINSCLPGGDLFGPIPDNRSVLGFGRYVRDLRQEYAWLPADVVERYAQAYETRIKLLLGGRKSLHEMGEEIAAGLYPAEVQYLMQHEWADCAVDILWRRSKLGLHLPVETSKKLNAWICAHRLGE
jgi:glycerol-3-phosphate dehydrogenase